MNKHKLSILALSAVMLVTSCRKIDVTPENALPTPTVTAPAIAASSAWKNAGWGTTADGKGQKATFQDSLISSNVIENGMVLVYKKSGNDIKALPLQEDGAYWYYQASTGDLTISVDAADKASTTNGTSFRYFVISEQKLADLEAAGTSRFKLMDLSFADAEALLK